MATKPVKPAVSASAAAESLQTGTAPAEAENTAVTVFQPMKLPEKFKVKRVLTLPTLNLREGAGVTLRIDTAPAISDVVDKSGQKGPATVSDVTDVETGQQMRWLIPSVVMSNFIKAYSRSDEHKAAALKAQDAEPKKQIDGSVLAAADVQIVGMVFAVQNMGKRKEGQRYWDYNIVELELESA